MFSQFNVLTATVICFRRYNTGFFLCRFEWKGTMSCAWLRSRRVIHPSDCPVKLYGANKEVCREKLCTEREMVCVPERGSENVRGMKLPMQRQGGRDAQKDSLESITVRQKCDHARSSSQQKPGRSLLHSSSTSRRTPDSFRRCLTVISGVFLADGPHGAPCFVAVVGFP